MLQFDSWLAPLGHDPTGTPAVELPVGRWDMRGRRADHEDRFRQKPILVAIHSLQILRNLQLLRAHGFAKGIWYNIQQLFAIAYEVWA